MQNQSQLLYTDYIVFSISAQASSRNNHISSRLRLARVDMDREMIAGTIWQRLCIDIIIIYFQQIVFTRQTQN